MPPGIDGVQFGLEPSLPSHRARRCILRHRGECSGDSNPETRQARASPTDRSWRAVRSKTRSSICHVSRAAGSRPASGVGAPSAGGSPRLVLFKFWLTRARAPSHANHMIEEFNLNVEVISRLHAEAKVGKQGLNRLCRPSLRRVRHDCQKLVWFKGRELRRHTLSVGVTRSETAALRCGSQIGDPGAPGDGRLRRWRGSFAHLAGHDPIDRRPRAGAELVRIEGAGRRRPTTRPARRRSRECSSGSLDRGVPSGSLGGWPRGARRARRSRRSSFARRPRSATTSASNDTPTGAVDFGSQLSTTRRHARQVGA